MSKVHRNFVLVALGIIALLMGSFITADFLNFAYRPNLNTLYPYLPKLLTSFTVSLIGWTIGTSGLQKRDSLLVSLYFVLIFAGDICLTVVALMADKPITGRYFELGFAIFMLAHVLMMVRLWPWATVGGNLKSIGFPGWLAMGIFVPATAVMVILGPAMATHGLLIPGLIYNYLIAGTLFLAALSIYNGTMPRANAILMFLGYLGFYLCDILGAIYNSYPGTTLSLFVVGLIWIAYAPGIAMTALSGLSWTRLDAPKR